jgi:hypothetical protein
MFDFKQFENLSKDARQTIFEETVNETLSGSNLGNSLPTIITQKREVAIAARMTSKPFTWQKFLAQGASLITQGGTKVYTGMDIARIFVDSAQTSKKGVTYYPIAGDWTKSGIKQLVLFVKDGRKYQAFARFKVLSIRSGTSMTSDEMATLVDVSFLAYCSFKSILEIELIESTVNGDVLPQDYLGNRSGKSVYDVAFAGSSPNLMII